MIQEEHLNNQQLKAPVNQKVSIFQSLLGNFKSMISKVKGPKLPIESTMYSKKNGPQIDEAETIALPMLKKSISDPIEPAKGDIEELKELIINMEPNSVNFPMKKDYKNGQRCPLCCQDLKEAPHIVNYCCTPMHFHSYCAFQFLNTSAQTVFKPIICPVGCERHIKINEIEQICRLIQKINPEVKMSRNIIRYISHNRILADPNNLFICPYTQCLGVISRKNQSEFVNCQECKREVCLKCDRASHKGFDCINSYQEEKVKLDEKFNEVVKNRKYQTCPGCLKVISRVDGCRCMSCICGIEFCYWCGKILNWDYPQGDEYCRCNDDAMEELDEEYYL